MNIFEYVRDQEQQYASDTVTVSGKDYNQKDRIDAVEIAAMCMYQESDADAILGKLTYDDIISEKFDKEAQILDFDTKHLDIAAKKPTAEARFKAMVASSGVRDQMEKDRYGAFFNKWVRTYSKYGGVITKKTEQGPEVISWHNVVTDQTDILAGIIIEKHYYTPAELKRMDGIWDNVDDALLLAEEYKQQSANNYTKKSDTQGHYIEVHEVHGELPESILKDDGDPLKFKRVIMILAGVNNDNDENEENGVVLYQEEERDNPYKYLARNPIDGVALGRGIFEELLPQQVIHNFVVNEELKMVAITNKIYAKTNKQELPKSVAQLDQLSVLKLNDDEYFELESATGRSLPGLRDLRDHVLNNVQRITGQHESLSGEEGKANKPFALQRLQNIEGHSRFRPKRQDIGFHFEEIVKDWTMPDALKKIGRENELYSRYEDNQLIQLDRILMAKNQRRILLEEGRAVTLDDEAEFTRLLSQQGKKRFIEDVKDFLKDINKDIRVSFTNESFDKGDFYDSRVAFVQLLGPEHPWSQAMIRKSIDEAGITPEELAAAEEQAIPAQGSARNLNIPGNEQVAPAQQ